MAARPRRTIGRTTWSSSPTPSERCSAQSRSRSSGSTAAGSSSVVAIRTPMPRAISSGTAATTLAKFSGPRISSLGSGSGWSSEIWTLTGSPDSRSSAARRRPVNSVPLESTTTGRIAASSAISSGHVVEQERLAAGHPERREAQLARLARASDHRLGRELPPLHARRGLGQAVGALEVAVVVGVHPQPVADPAFLDRIRDRAHRSPSASRRRSVSGLVGNASALQ